MELSLSTSVQYVPRVGPVMARRLKKLGIETVKDLLWHVPFRYNDYSLVSKIARVQPGETVTIQGTVESIRTVVTKNRKQIQQAVVGDDSGSIEAVWFNQPFLLRIIRTSDTIHLAGRVGWFGSKMVLESPEYELVKSQISNPSYHSLHTGRLVPVYPETEGVSSKWIRGRIAYLLSQVADTIEEYLPRAVLEEFSLLPLSGATRTIHFPTHLDEAKRARERLSFDELFLLLLRAYDQKRLWQSTRRAHQILLHTTELQGFIDRLPFVLTSDQQRATSDILSDLSKGLPMNRLLLGDVGSGKTVVAACALYAVFQSGYRSVLMAPTQILAHQHYETIHRLLSPLGVQVELVTSDSRRKTRGAKRDRSPFLLVGTHALLSESVSFENVALVVIDEQQRFGVEQRTILRKKAEGDITPHLLTMTATPIPRTVARTLYGNLDLSILREMPKGRLRVKTWVVPQEKRHRAYAWIRQHIMETGGQAFIVCPLIEESESLRTVKSVKAEFERLKIIFPQFSLGLLHGRMKAKEKSEALKRFRTQKDAILLATPVVEVGIDVPNATIIVIEAAERFGLAQLHQLRGRVGRGSIASFCLLFTEQEDELILARLKAMETIFNGPELAELDLRLRGPGELFGTKQHGVPLLKVASLSDSELLHCAEQAVRTVTHQNPDLSRFPLLRQKLEESTIEDTLQD